MTDCDFAHPGAVAFSACLAALPSGLAAEPLTALFDACDRVLIEATYEGVADYGLTKFENRMVALAVTEWPERGIHECTVLGYDLRRPATASEPTLTAGDARPFAEDWFARRIQSPDAGQLPDLYGNGSVMIAICPDSDDRGGHFAAHHADVHYHDVDLPPEQRAMYFRVGRNAPERDTPCQFKERFAK